MIIIDHELCDLCGTCVGVCPPDCISMSGSDVEIDHESCIQCGFCVQVCPLEALKKEENNDQA
jgi:NAD-dependent dihydropyrimidine dehydrogenase PreA subunit